MLQFLRRAAAVVAVFASLSVGRAEAACQLITATHSAATKAEAAQSSRALEPCHSKCPKGEGRSILESS
jgi:hypothetical protein